MQKNLNKNRNLPTKKVIRQ